MLGLSNSRNLGLDSCSGKYVLFVNGSDKLKNDMAIEHMTVTDEDILMLEKYSKKEISMNDAINNIIKGEL